MPSCHPAQSSGMVTLPAGETRSPVSDAQDWSGAAGPRLEWAPEGWYQALCKGQVVALLSSGIVALSGASLRPPGLGHRACDRVPWDCTGLPEAGLPPTPGPAQKSRR